MAGRIEAKATVRPYGDRDVGGQRQHPKIACVRNGENLGKIPSRASRGHGSIERYFESATDDPYVDGSRSYKVCINNDQDQSDHVRNKKSGPIRWTAPPPKVKIEMWEGGMGKEIRDTKNLCKGKSRPIGPPAKHSIATRIEHEGFTQVSGHSSVHRYDSLGNKILSRRERRLLRTLDDDSLPDGCSSVVAEPGPPPVEIDWGIFEDIVSAQHCGRTNATACLDKITWPTPDVAVGAGVIACFMFHFFTVWVLATIIVRCVLLLIKGFIMPRRSDVDHATCDTGEAQDPGYFIQAVLFAPFYEETLKRLLPHCLYGPVAPFGRSGVEMTLGSAWVVFFILLELRGHLLVSRGQPKGYTISCFIAVMHFATWAMPLWMGVLVHACGNWLAWLFDLKLDTSTRACGMLLGRTKHKPRKKTGGVGIRQVVDKAHDGGGGSDGVDDMRTVYDSLPTHVVVYNRDHPCVAIFHGEECYLPFGSLDLVTKRGKVLSRPTHDCRLDDGKLGMIHGYKPAHDGHYIKVDYTPCHTEEEFSAQQDEHVYQLRPCGRWELLHQFEIGNVRTDTQEVFVCAALLAAAQKIGRGKTTDAQFAGVIANLHNTHPNFNHAHIHNAVLKHTYDLLVARSMASNQLVRAGQLISSNTITPAADVKDVLGLGGFSEYADVCAKKLVRFDRGKKEYVWYSSLKKIPGVCLDGSLAPGFTMDVHRVVPDQATLVVIPETTPRWVVRAGAGPIRFMENFLYENAGVGEITPERECRLAYFPDKNLARNRAGEIVPTGYQSMGLSIRSTHVSGHVVVYDDTPTALLDAVYGRALMKLPGEDTFCDNQKKVLLHVKFLDTVLFDMMMEGIVKGNDRQASAAFYADQAIYEREMADLDSGLGVCKLPALGYEPFAVSKRPWELYDDDLFERVGRRAAAIALVDRMRSMQKNQIVSNQHSRYVTGAMVIQFGCLLWYAIQSPALGELLVVRAFIGGFLASVAGLLSILCYELVKTHVKGSPVYSVDEAGFTHRYMRYPVLGSAIYSMWMNAHRKHVKMRQYLRTLGFHWASEPEIFAGSHVDLAITAADVILKKHEGSKYGKVARFIVSCGWATLALQGAATHVKKMFSGPRDLGLLLTEAFPMLPSLPFVQEPLHTLPVDLHVPRWFCRLLSYSDDEFYVILVGGFRIFVCADASSADSCVSGAITLGILPALYKMVGSDIPVWTIIYNFIRPWKVTSPHNRHHYFTMTAADAAMPSGDSNTTLLQNIFSSLRAASFAAMLNLSLHLSELKRQSVRGGDGSYAPDRQKLENLMERLVKLSAHSVGGISTVDITIDPQKSTLLKRTLMYDTTGELCYMLVYGAILSNFGSYAGDLEPATLGLDPAVFGKLSIPARWEKHLCNVVAGLVHEPSSILLDALRARFPRGDVVRGVTADEQFKSDLQAETADNSRRTIPLDEIIKRYGGEYHEWTEFCDSIRTIEYGQVLEHSIMHRIRSDYGIAPLPE